MFVGQMYCQILSELVDLQTSAANCPVANCSLFALETLVFSRIFQLSSRYTVNTKCFHTKHYQGSVFFFFFCLRTCMYRFISMRSLSQHYLLEQFEKAIEK